MKRLTMLLVFAMIGLIAGGVLILLGAVAMTIDSAQHDGACADLLRRCQFDAGEPPRHPFPGVAGSEEIGITLEKRERRSDRVGLTPVETPDELDDP